MTRNIDTLTNGAVWDETTDELDHVTVRNDDAPDECAIFPADGTDDELDTTWIVALEGAFVDRESMR